MAKSLQHLILDILWVSRWHSTVLHTAMLVWSANGCRTIVSHGNLCREGGKEWKMEEQFQRTRFPQFDYFGLKPDAIPLWKAVTILTSWISDADGPCKYVTISDLSHVYRFVRDREFKASISRAHLRLCGSSMLALSRIPFSNENMPVIHMSRLVQELLLSLGNARTAGTGAERRVVIVGTTASMKRLGLVDTAALPGIQLERWEPVDGHIDYLRTEMLNRLDASSPDLVILGDAFPEQELWAYRNHVHLNAKIVICAGTTGRGYCSSQLGGRSTVRFPKAAGWLSRAWKYSVRHIHRYWGLLLLFFLVQKRLGEQFYKQLMSEAAVRSVPKYAREAQQMYFVVATARTGSNALMAMLNSHSDVSGVNEVLNARTRWGPASFSQTKKEVLHHVDRILPRNKSVVGAKLMLDQMEHFSIEADDILNTFPGARFIILYRKNAVQQFVSRLVAIETGRWKTTRRRHENHKVIFDIDAYSDFRSENTRLYKSFLTNKRVQDSSILLDYESFANTPFETTRDALLPFLGLEDSGLKLDLKKQDWRGLEASIANYSEVRPLLEKEPPFEPFMTKLLP